MEPIGRRRWAIAEGWIPASSTGPEPEMTSHETACILNAGDREARVEITIFFADREPVGPYRVRVPARRTLHLRFNDLEDPEPDPPGHRLRERDRGGRADRGAAYPSGFAPGGERAAHHHRLRSRLTARVTVEKRRERRSGTRTRSSTPWTSSASRTPTATGCGDFPRADQPPRLPRARWASPASGCSRSTARPNRDNGYDIQDYYSVDPRLRDAGRLRWSSCTGRGSTGSG